MKTEARGILFVDDEATSCKWFARRFGDEFEVATANSADEALGILVRRGDEFAALVTDYRMPDQDGMRLLRRVQSDHRHLIRLLATAYAEKDVAIAAVNQGKVLRILEKPLEYEPTREALQEALALYRTQAVERALHEGGAAALRETLGFLAHELNTPLATVRGYVGSVADRLRPAAVQALAAPHARGHQPGELVTALERADRRAQYCQSLIATFVQSARDAYPGTPPQTANASGLLAALVDEYPFEEAERSWLTASVARDFRLCGRRGLLYLVLCTLTKNALQALRGVVAPRLHIEAGCDAAHDTPPRGWIRFTDNGPGIPGDLLARLTREPMTTRAATGGSGMGLIFCQRVMQAAGGSIRIDSTVGVGTVVKLSFDSGVQLADAAPPG